MKGFPFKYLREGICEQWQKRVQNLRIKRSKLLKNQL